MTRFNFDYPEDEHEEWKVAATRKGQTLKEWGRRAMNAAAAREKAERAAERKR